MKIRQIEEKDRQVWEKLWTKYLIFYKEEERADVREANWKKFMSKKGNTECIVIEDDQGVVSGFAHTIIHESTWELTDICYLEDLYVSEECRGKKYGKALIDELLNICKKRGLSRLYWTTQNFNTTARKLYDHYSPADGFVRYVIKT